jgi:hypothetical protein
LGAAALCRPVVCGVHMGRGAPASGAQLLGEPKRKRRKTVEQTPSTLNSSASANLADGGIADQNVPCGASGRGDAEAFGTNSGPADSTSSKLPSTSQGSAKHAD